jgi:uncharacterized protein YndB with AHSA1/START domain
MQMLTNAISETQMDQEIMVSHLLNAPRGVAYRAWTDPDRLRQWWGSSPDDIAADLDVKPGGYWSVSVKAQDGKHWFRGVFQKVVKHEELKFTLIWHGPNGYSSLLTQCTLTFADLGDKTGLTFHQSSFGSPDQRDEYQEGWQACYERYAAYVESDWHAAVAA